MKKLVFALVGVLLMTANGFSQDKYGDTPEQQQKCKENLSLYREYRDQKLYDDALPFWRKAFQTCPKSSKSLYIDGARFYGDILDEIYEDSTKMDVRNAYIDTLMMVYDKRIENFGDEGRVLGYKGADLFQYDQSRASEANALLKRSMELDGNDTDAKVASKYYQSLYEMYKNDEATKSDLLVEYMPVVEILDYNIAMTDDEKQKRRYEKAKGNLDAFFVKIAECDDIYRILGERIDQSPNDIELNKKALAVMNKRDCSDNELYLQVAERVYADKPTADAAYSIGIQKLKVKEYSDALKYFEEAVSLCGDCIHSGQYHLRAGQAATILGRVSTAKSHANSILAKEPKNGEAYMLIGDAIVGSANSCDDKLGAGAVYWVATDYYSRAKSVDSSVADKANQKIAGYKKYFPDKQAIFFNNLEIGGKYTVGCLGETTTIRSSD